MTPQTPVEEEKKEYPDELPKAHWVKCSKADCEKPAKRQGQIYCSRDCAPLGRYDDGKFGHGFSSLSRHQENHKTTEEMAVITKAPIQTLRRWARDKLIPSDRTEFGLAFVEEDVLAAMKKNGLPKGRKY